MSIDVKNNHVHAAYRKSRRIPVLVLTGLAILGLELGIAAKAWMAPAPLPQAANTTPAFPLKLSVNQRYLVDQNNQPFFWSGDAGWSLIAQGTNADIDYYMANRQQKGFDAVLVNLIEHKFATNAPKNINGDAPFTGAPFATPNEAYFAHADYVIAVAAAHGIVVLLDPLYIGYVCGDEGWCAEIQAASTSDLQAWGQYVGNRYKSFDNIVWLVGGDTDPTAYSGLPAKVTAFITGLQSADTRHLITAHNSRGEMAVTQWPGASWLTLNDIYSTYGGTYQMGQTAYNYAPTLPFFQVEGYYENEHGMTTQQLRAQAYWTILSGGMGYVFGNCPLWGLGSPAAAFCPSANPNWKLQLDNAGSVSMANVQALFQSKSWQNLVPDWGHAVVTAGYGTWGGTDYATTGRTPDGSLGVAYLPSSRTVTVAMSQMSSPVTARWYDPSNGTYSIVSGSPFANSGTQQFTPSSTNSSGDTDWVLVLEAGSQMPTPTSNALATSTTIAAPTIVAPTPTTTPASGESPYGGTAWTIPGTMQIENYDTGGEGIGYHDTDPANLGGQYRNDGVDIQTTADTGGGYNVGWTRPGEWLNYTVKVTQTGVYSLGLRVAHAAAGALCHVEIDGANVTGPIAIPNTGGFQAWQTITVSNVSLAQGNHIMRVSMDTAAAGSGSVGNYNYFTLALQGSPAPTATGAATGTATTAPATSTPTAGITRTPTQMPATSTPTAGITRTPTQMLATATPTVAPRTSANGLVAAFGFNEGNGNNVTDSSGNGNNGTISSPSWTTGGKFGNALSFGTTAQRVVVPDSASLHLLNGMTLEAWVYPTSTMAGWKSVILKEQPAELVYSLYANGDVQQPSSYIFSNGGEQGVEGGSALPLNTWTHLAATFDGAAIKVYANGNLVASDAYSGSITVSNGSLGIGGNGVWSSEVFPGRIDEVRIYNRALSQLEIQTDMNSPVN